MNQEFLIKLLSKGYLVCEEKRKKEHHYKFISKINDSFGSFNYALDEEGINELHYYSKCSLMNFYNNCLNLMKSVKGANVNHIIFYPNFPDMEEITEQEYAFRADFHYHTVKEDNQGFMNEDLPFHQVETTLHKEEKAILKLINKDQAIKLLADIVNNYFEQQNVIPECNKEFIKLFVAEYPLLLSPQQIPFKENLAFYISLIIKNQKEDKLGNIITLNHLSFIKTATDLLRFYAAISLSDITLTSKIKLITIDRKLRRLFLNVLENLTIKNEEAVINDLSRHEAHFKIVLEKLHVGEYASRYPIFFSVAKKFRNNQYQTYYSLLEQNRNNIDILLPLLESHPGEFARRLDAVIRNNPLYIDQILASFEHVAHKVSTNVLISLYNHFSNRITSLFSDRIFCVKTNKGIKYISKNDNRFNIKSETIDKIKLLIKETLKEKFASLPFINNVYLSPKLSAYGLIRNNRNTSKNHKTLTYGTRIKLPEAKTNFLRFFTHWKNIAKKDSKSSCRVDIDLSVSLIGNNPYSFRDLAWFNMSGGKNIDSFHSGDLTSAPNGASEFIDLNIEQARKKYCYALVSNIVYTGQSFSEIPECFSGVMFVNNLGKKGAVFNPKLVEQKFDLVQENTNQNIAFIVDLINLELIWVDIPNNVFINSSIDCYRGYLFNILQDALKNRLSVYDFFLLHEKHMNFVTNKEDAKFIIDEENADITPFDMEIISSQFM